jgi:REP element-mobilizing transposase RayT
MLSPLYTAANCKPAYELRWSLALFSKSDLPDPDAWFEALRARTESDGVRLLEHHFKPPNIWFFLVSTKPHVAPPKVIKSVKGRLQNLIQDAAPKAFRRNFSLTSVGHVRREVVEAYVAGQLGHHQMVDAAVQQRFEEFQLSWPDVDLSHAQLSSHGQYLFNLHLVLVHRDRWSDISRERLETTRDIVIGVAAKKQHRLSRLSIFADHLHLTLGCHYERSPQDVALGYLNNLAYAHGMNELYCFSYYVGTFGEYDMGAIWSA